MSSILHYIQPANMADDITAAINLFVLKTNDDFDGLLDPPFVKVSDVDEGCMVSIIFEQTPYMLQEDYYEYLTNLIDGYLIGRGHSPAIVFSEIGDATNLST